MKSNYPLSVSVMERSWSTAGGGTCRWSYQVITRKSTAWTPKKDSSSVDPETEQPGSEQLYNSDLLMWYTAPWCLQSTLVLQRIRLTDINLIALKHLQIISFPFIMILFQQYLMSVHAHIIKHDFCFSRSGL